MILTPAQRRDYEVAVKNGTTANELAILRRNLALKFGSDWWRLHREEVMAELRKLEGK